MVNKTFAQVQNALNGSIYEDFLNLRYDKQRKTLLKHYFPEKCSVESLYSKNILNFKLNVKHQFNMFNIYFWNKLIPN